MGKRMHEAEATNPSEVGDFLRLTPEMFSGASAAELRTAIVAEYNQRMNSKIERYEGITTRSTNFVYRFNVIFKDKKYTGSWQNVRRNIYRLYKLKLSPKDCLKFLDLLADGGGLEEAKRKVLILEEERVKTTDALKAMRPKPEMFSGASAAKLRTAIVAEYNQRMNSKIERYEEITTTPSSFLYLFKIVFENTEYTDSWQNVCNRINTHHKLNLSKKNCLKFLDLLADGKNVEEARAEILTLEKQRTETQSQRLTPEMFTSASAPGIRTAIVAEYNQRMNSKIERYEEMSKSSNNFKIKLNISFASKKYVDSLANIYSKIKIHFKLNLSKKNFLKFLDILADGKSVEEAKAEIGAQIEVEKEAERITGEFKAEIKKIATDPALLEKFKVWVSLFGPHTAADILFAHHPQYKKVQDAFVKSVIGDYLGATLVLIPPFKPENLAYLEKRFLENPDLQAGLYVCLVQNCSSHLARKKIKANTASKEVSEYLASLTQKVPTEAQDLFLEISKKVNEYFHKNFDTWERPARMTASLTDDREFPDIAQIINIQELKEQRHLLIADRMGVGKSGSVIVAKEHLGVKQALVMAPANVISTWQEYLSDQDKKGYFVEGKKPKVCVISSLADVESKDAQEAEYVIISHERLDSEYATALKKLNSEMLIVDEVHGFKNPHGVRGQALQDLAKQFENPEKYVALLSATPAPNKVKDIAIVLKLLYPERFATLEVKELALQIINGDITDLRALLVPKMQRKTLAETVDMPPLLEEEIEITLNPWFKKAYEVILQDDELSPMQKITILRQFLLNPAILELEPPGEHQMGKQVRLEQDIQTHFSEGRNKIIVVFNDFVKGLTQGENRLIQDIRYPTNCKVCIMDGNTPEGDRIAIQKQLNESDEPMVLFLSGKVGGVGINLSGAHVMIQYNEPWSKEEKAQQIGRCYRPGLKQPLLVQTYITSGTMEEGIHRHIDLKDKAIQKLLAGVKLTELEQRILSEDNEIAEDDLEVNPELASYYLNSFQDLLAMFGSIKNIGEEHFQEFLAKYGDRYAGNYSVLGDRSYQSNVARVNANILSQFVGSTNGHILDLASGPEMLRKRALSGQASNVISLDINQGHFVTKSTDGIWQKTEGTTTAVVGGISQIPVKTEAVVAVNLALGLHYTSFRPSQNDFERLRTICEINRVLQIGGKALITLQHGTEFKNETGFKELITLAGFTIDEKYTGEILGENFQARTYALVKTETADFETLKELIKEDKTEEKTLADSLKLNFAGHKKTFRDTRGILTAITLGKQTITLELNETDKTALAEEQAIHSLAESLQSIHGEIKEIPRDILIRHKFARIKLGGHYVLFKELEKSKGVILIKSH